MSLHPLVRRILIRIAFWWLRTVPHALFADGWGFSAFLSQLRSQARPGLHDVPRMGLISSRQDSHHRPASLLASNPFYPAIPFGTGLSRAPAPEYKLSFRLAEFRAIPLRWHYQHCPPDLINMPSLVQRLFDGAFDIVGDVHGDIDALMHLIHHLGYGKDGIHSEGRRLIFVGDLTDRGPDSVAVVRFVSRLVDKGIAQCVLGNHELNILLNQRKFDNGWFFGEEFRDPETNEVVNQVLADDSIRSEMVDFFLKLPLASLGGNTAMPFFMSTW